jgi:hypothetical protein
LAGNKSCENNAPSSANIDGDLTLHRKVSAVYISFHARQALAVARDQAFSTSRHGTLLASIAFAGGTYVQAEQDRATDGRAFAAQQKARANIRRRERRGVAARR